MKQIFKNLLDSKSQLQEAQINFTLACQKRYPTLVLINSDDLCRNINDEMDFLLSNSIRVKSGRVKILAKTGQSWIDQNLILTRTPGLKRPYSSYRDIQFLDVKEVLDNGDLLMRKETNDGQYLKVEMSFLRSSDMIIQQKLEIFYGYLKETLEFRKRVKELISYRYSDVNEIEIKNSKSKIQILAEDFMLKIHNPKDNTFDEIVSSNVQDYNSRDFDDFTSKDSIPEENQITYQSILLKVLKDFDSFDKALKVCEWKKKEFIDIGNDLFDKLKEENKPARILVKLMKT